MVQSFSTYQQFETKPCNLPLERQSTPDDPWQSMASDLSDFDGTQGMIVADVYSKMCFLRKRPLPGATAATVVSKMKEFFMDIE